MAEFQQMNRVFRMGTTTIPDPAPGEPPEQALNHLRGVFPVLAHATIDGPVVEGGQLVYTVLRPPAQTKGAQVPARAS